MGDIVKFTESTVGELDSKLKDVRIPQANLGPCPVCGHDIVENRKGYSCWARDDPGCGFVIWKSKAGKTLPVVVARELIKTGRTEKAVSGFKGRSGRSFRARLALQQSEDGKWRGGARGGGGEGGGQPAGGEGWRGRAHRRRDVAGCRRSGLNDSHPPAAASRLRRYGHGARQGRSVDVAPRARRGERGRGRRARRAT